MRIGQNDNYLSIELDSSIVDYPPMRVEAVCTAFGRRFTASHDGVIISSEKVSLQRFTDFESLRIEEMEIALTCEGWIHFQRDPRGYITVRYRIEGWNPPAAMEGTVVVEGEYTASFYREFGELLRSMI
jgi:hypothetical protein